MSAVGSVLWGEGRLSLALRSGAQVPASGALWPLFTRSHLTRWSWTPAGFHGDHWLAVCDDGPDGAGDDGGDGAAGQDGDEPGGGGCAVGMGFHWPTSRPATAPSDMRMYQM